MKAETEMEGELVIALSPSSIKSNFLLERSMERNNADVDVDVDANADSPDEDEGVGGAVIDEDLLLRTSTLALLRQFQMNNGRFDEEDPDKLALVKGSVDKSVACIAFRGQDVAAIAFTMRRLYTQNDERDKRFEVLANNRVLVARGTSVMAVDLATRAVTPGLAAGARLHDALPVNGELLVTNGGNATARFADAKTGTTLATVPTGMNAGVRMIPRGVTTSPRRAPPSLPSAR
jgi:hypothetical protein